MKSLRQLSVALIFTFVLALPTFAGEISTTIAQPPTQTTTTGGEMETGITGQIETPGGEANVADSATEIALNLLQSMLALF